MGRASPLLIVAGRVIVLWTVEVLVLWALAQTPAGIHLDHWQTGVMTVGLVGALNALFRPLLS
jgi:uncharacterized membrane protein YvlD (DUF360 family)